MQKSGGKIAQVPIVLYKNLSNFSLDENNFRRCDLLNIAHQTPTYDGRSKHIRTDFIYRHNIKGSNLKVGHFGALTGYSSI